MWNKEVYLILLVVGAAVGEKYKFCMNVQTNCDKITPDNVKVECVKNTHRAECITKLLNGTADFGFLNTEELLLLNKMSTGNKKFNVVANVINSVPKYDYQFETVAIVKKDHSTGLKGLENYTYYRTDFGNNDWTPRVLEAFERKVVNISSSTGCRTGSTEDDMLSKELKQFFKAACRSGSWSPNQHVNLTTKYKELCSACDDIGQCTYNNEDKALTKLIAHNSTYGNAVAYVTWEETVEFFKDPSIASQYALLCPNNNEPLTPDLLRNKSVKAGCAFVSQPYSAIVAVTEKSEKINGDLKDWFPNGDKTAEAVEGHEWKNAIYEDVNTERTLKLNFDKKALHEYLPGVESTTYTECIPEHTWFVTSEDEKKKCQLLTSAASIIGVTPKVSCEVETDREKTMKTLNNTETKGFVVSPSNDGYIAKKVYKLVAAKTLNSNTQIVAVIKTDAVVPDFRNFSSNHACFPKFGGLAHVAYINKMRSLNVISKEECDFGKVVGEQFGSACLPGADTASTLFPYSNSSTTKICDCKKTDNTATCAANSTNKYYDNALKCLTDDETAIAFLDLKSVLAPDYDKYKVLCFNDDNKTVTFASNIAESCILAHVIDQEILTSESSFNIVKTFFDYLKTYLSKHTESKSFLIQLDMFLDQKIFHLPATDFQETEDKAMKEYEKLLTDVSKCTPPTPPSPSPNGTDTTTAAPTTAKQNSGTRSVYSVITLFLLALMSRFL